jgi:hypothetical protein
MSKTELEAFDERIGSNCAASNYEQQETKLSTAIAERYSRYGHNDGSGTTTHNEPEMAFCTGPIRPYTKTYNPGIHTTIKNRVTCSSSSGPYRQQSYKSTTIIYERYEDDHDHWRNVDTPSLKLARVKLLMFIQLHTMLAHAFPKSNMLKT